MWELRGLPLGKISFGQLVCTQVYSPLKGDNNLQEPSNSHNARTKITQTRTNSKMKQHHNSHRR
jgi:hypothetical protein